MNGASPFPLPFESQIRGLLGTLCSGLVLRRSLGLAPEMSIVMNHMGSAFSLEMAIIAAVHAAYEIFDHIPCFP